MAEGKRSQFRTIRIIKHLAEDIKRRLSRLPWSEDSFANIAYDRLAEARMHETFKEDDILAWLYKTTRLPRQLDCWMSFGQPPLTVWRDDSFLIDVYFWTRPEIDIHSHSFAGAFCNLYGESFHCQYDFKANDRNFSSGILTGQLELRQAEYLSSGAVRKIISGSAFIHRLWHLSRPTITIVARTAISRPKLRPYRYLLPGMAIEAREMSEISIRRRQFLRYLFERKHPERNLFAEAAIASSKPWESFGLFHDWIRLRNVVDTEKFLLPKSITSRHGCWIFSAQRALATLRRVEEINWERTGNVQERLFLALLLSYPNQLPIANWMATIAGTNWKANTAKLISRMTANGVLGASLSGSQLRIVANLEEACSMRTQ
jgi:hypothetical protein